jgi:hypothetical protein
MATPEQMKARIDRLIAEGKCVQCSKFKTNAERRCSECLEKDRAIHKLRYVKPRIRKVNAGIVRPVRGPAEAGTPLTAQELEVLRNTPTTEFFAHSCS